MLPGGTVRSTRERGRVLNRREEEHVILGSYTSRVDLRVGDSQNRSKSEERRTEDLTWKSMIFEVREVGRVLTIR